MFCIDTSSLPISTRNALFAVSQFQTPDGTVEMAFLTCCSLQNHRWETPSHIQVAHWAVWRKSVFGWMLLANGILFFSQLHCSCPCIAIRKLCSD